MRIIVIGGSGLIGSRLVERLRRQGHEVIAASRSSGIDALTGTGLRDAMDAAQVVIDVSNPPASGSGAPQDFFLRAGINISAEAASSGVSHHLVLSVVGTDHPLDSDYFRAKALQENLVRQSGIPYTIVRSTQFFEFLLPIADFGTENQTVRLSTALIQPVAADDVADALALAALQPPANETIELAGPEPVRLSDIVERLLAAKRDERTVIGDPDTPYFGVNLSERTLMPRGNPRIAPTTFDAWLAKTRLIA